MKQKNASSERSISTKSTQRVNFKLLFFIKSVVCLANGVSMENVAKMLGHANTRMTQHYAKVLDNSILRDMMNVEQQLTQR